MKNFATMLWQHATITVLCVAMIIVPSTVVTTGCSSGQVITVVANITKFSPVVINVLQLACAFNPAAPLCAFGAANLEKTITELEAALTAYQAAVAAGTATASTWNALNAVFTVFESQTAAIFELFHISGAASQQAAMAVVAAAQTLLSVIEALFPAAPVVGEAREEVRHHPTPYAQKMGITPPVGGVAFFNYPAWEKSYNKKVDAANKAIPAAHLVHVKVK